MSALVGALLFRMQEVSERRRTVTGVSGELFKVVLFQKPLFLPIIAYTLSSTKLEIRAK
jgi:hypothetical protein